MHSVQLESARRRLRDACLQPPLRRRLAALALPMLLLMPGCGPGVGGTGQPVDGLNALGATAQPVCAGDLATVLNCAGLAGAVPAPVPVAASPRTWFADESTAPRVLASAADEITYHSACEGLRFNGIWGQAPGQSQRYYGLLESADRVTPAMLTVQRVDTGVRFQLFDANDRPVGGAQLLRRVDPPLGPAACR